MSELSHLDEAGNARMVDVGGKEVTDRRAVASAVVRMSPETAETVRRGDAPKGDVSARRDSRASRPPSAPRS